MIKQEFLKKMQEKKYFQDHQKVLVAVSGGLDSMTLLQLLILKKNWISSLLLLMLTTNSGQSQIKKKRH